MRPEGRLQGRSAILTNQNEIMKYYADFVANNGRTAVWKPFEYTNKRDAIRDIRKIVKGNHFHQPGNISDYYVWDANGLCVMHGRLCGYGRWVVLWGDVYNLLR